MHMHEIDILWTISMAINNVFEIEFFNRWNILRWEEYKFTHPRVFFMQKSRKVIRSCLYFLDFKLHALPQYF